MWSSTHSFWLATRIWPHRRKSSAVAVALDSFIKLIIGGSLVVAPTNWTKSSDCVSVFVAIFAESG